jgi:sugar lactone lactonase YvrE
MQYRQTRTISGKGPGPDQFAEALHGITVAADGMVWAVGGKDVRAFEASGKLEHHWRTDQPAYCVAVDAGAAVYVGQSGQITKYDAEGKLQAAMQDADRFGVVTAIWPWGDCLLVADAKGRCIRRCDTGGQWLNDIGKDNRTHGFVIPNKYLDFAVDGRGVVYAASSGKHRIERYSLDGELLGFWGKFGTREPAGFPGCCNPTNVALTTQGHIVVTEKAAPRVKVYTAEGELLTAFGSEDFDPNCKNMDVAVDSSDRIYVADTVRLHIQVFEPVGAADEAAPAVAGVGQS